MAEYYAVLSRAVASLEANTPEARRAVYDKARNALIGQLKAIVPPLPTSEISRQRLELEEAIRRAEREAVSGAPAAPQRATAPRRVGPTPSAPPPQPPPVQPAPQYQQPPPRPAPPQSVAPPPPPVEDIGEDEADASHSPQEVFRRAIREAENRADIVPVTPVERAPVREEAFGNTGTQFRVADRPRRGPPPPPQEPPPYVPPDYHVPRRSPSEPEPRLAPDYAWDKEAPQSEPLSPRHVPTPELDGDDRSARVRDGRRRGSRDRDAEADFEEAAVRPSRLPTILLLVLIVALVGGLAALGWWQRGELSKLFADSGTAGTGGSEQTAAAPPPPPPSPAAPSDAAPGKNDDRLLGGNAIATTPGVRVIGDAGDTGGAADTGTAGGTSADTSAAGAQASDTPPAAVATAEPPQPPAAQGGGAALVAQKAVLYEEPADGTKAADGVTQINAAVTWSYVADAPGGPSVVANLDVPDRGLTVKLTIHKNADKTLPASHLIEVVVATTAAFPGKGVSSIPRLVLKPSEDARGQPLVGATAKVQDGLFWIALSALPADIDSNMSLLKDRDWIDLPLVYDTGQRAILTFEKGNPGDGALAQAMAAWGAG